MIGTTQPFQDTPCKVIVGNNYDTAGSGSLTRSSVANLTPAQLQTLFKPGGLFADMDAWFRTSFEMKACGTKVNGLYEWINSSRKSMGDLLSAQKIDRGPSLLQPFVLGRQNSVINIVYWAITAGWTLTNYPTNAANPVLTAGDKNLGAGSDRVIRVVSRYGVDMDEKFFLNLDRLFIWGRAGGTATCGQWKVLASEPAADKSYVDVLITTENAGSTSAYDAAPIAGVVTLAGNNVNDFESYAKNRPTLDPRKRVPFWYQTMRRSRQVDSEYMKVFARLMEANEYYQNFGDLTMSERNRQDEELYQHQWLESFFYGKPISANQTMANWQSLEQITTVTGSTVDPGLGGKLIAYRANMVGVYQQLLACGRVFDLQNNALNFYEFLDEIYRIMRARKSQGREVKRIDVYTDQLTAANFETAFFAYMKAEYGDIIRINVETGSNDLGFDWRVFKPKFPQGIEIALITHEYFDDRVNAFTTEGIDSAGRQMLILDIGKPGPQGGTIYPGTIATNRKKRTLGELEQLARIDPTFAAVMEHVTQEISLISETTTAVVECPAHSLWISNVGSGVPVTTGRAGTLTDLY